MIAIDWKEATSSMKDEDFKAELQLFADLVEAKKARGMLVDVTHFRHKMGPGLQEWRVKNISSRYNAARVRRFAFVLPSGAPIPPIINQSVPLEVAKQAIRGRRARVVCGGPSGTVPISLARETVACDIDDH